MAGNPGLLTKALETLDPGRIGEINLLLDAVSRHAVSKDLTRRIISEMAARCDRIIRPIFILLLE